MRLEIVFLLFCDSVAKELSWRGLRMSERDRVWETRRLLFFYPWEEGQTMLTTRSGDD